MSFSFETVGYIFLKRVLIRRIAGLLCAQLSVDIVELELFVLAMACNQHGLGLQSMKFIIDDADSTAAQGWSSQMSQGCLLFRQ
jgi:hypothetical protein